MNQTVVEQQGNPENAKIIYILYLISLAVGVTSIVGVVMAYVNKDGAPEWLQSHYHFQIRSFWISLLYVVVSCILFIIVIGFLLLALWLVWFIVRCVKGLKALDQKQPIADVMTWGF
jgi:uncharacterized membrane protein